MNETTAAEAAQFDPAGLRYDANGLIPAIAQAQESGEVLMMAWMNEAAVRETLRQGRVVYWSRSRQAFWRKGDSSGHIQELTEMRVDCDSDCLLLTVRQTGPACHTGRRSCFYRAVEPEPEPGAEAGAEGWRMRERAPRRFAGPAAEE